MRVEQFNVLLCLFTNCLEMAPKVVVMHLDETLVKKLAFDDKDRIKYLLEGYCTSNSFIKTIIQAIGC
jgi:hypothetical protein